MDSKNTLQKQYVGFINTHSLFLENENFELFLFNHKNTKVAPKLKINSIPNNLVLGKRVELFFQNYIEHLENHTLLAANIQIIENKVTLGELDFILQDTLNNYFFHIEMVYKFYIYDPAINGELERWIGPNRRDTLLYKIIKLRNKQLPLFQDKVTQENLKLKKLPCEGVTQQVCFLAKLFVPIHLYGNHFKKINNNCIVGFWMSIETFANRHQADDLYCVPRKENWLIHPKNNTEWVSFDDSKNKIEVAIKKKKSILCWKKTSEKKYEQFFIVWWE